MKAERKENVKNIINWAQEKKAEDIIHLDVKGKSDFTDSIIICHGTAGLHIQAIANNIIQKAKENNIEILSVEGLNNAKWILLDLADIIVHIFDEETRKYYNLDDLYKISPEIKKNIETASDEK
ncbi:MAG: ribosome silencing factor [Candidatus Cloacimonetes bacterium]|nr:ribosome silencing factor [Candidatus Cloacimonadota bacterium]